MKNNIMVKNEYIGLRTTSKVKEALEKLSKKEFRTLSQQCEKILFEWLQEHGYLEDSED